MKHLFLTDEVRTLSLILHLPGAVFNILGRRHQITLATILYSEMWLSAVSYTIAAGTSMQFIADTACEWQGITDGCFSRTWCAVHGVV